MEAIINVPCTSSQCSKSAETDLQAAGKQPTALRGRQPGSSINKKKWNYRVNSEVKWGSLGDGQAGALTRCLGFS